MKKRIDYHKIIKNIPHQLWIKSKTTFEVLFSDNIRTDNNVLGETRFDTKQIIIKNNQSPKETTHTFWHEALHAIGDEVGANLTEAQVRALEKAFPAFYRLFKDLDKGNKCKNQKF